MNFFQCRKWPNLAQNKKNIYQRLYNVTYRSLSSLLPSICSQVLFNDNNILSPYISPKDPHTSEERQAKINTICNVTQRFCTGTLQQYSSFNDCQQFLRTQIPYGSYGRADQRNVICRFVHTYFVPLLPSIHCPHVGPTRRGACTDKTIDFYYNQPNFLACAHRQ
ncbi:unnamed protein product [Rotaria sp. Silwood1]|nr:unnamed protein product [Rotaria sp. Silwood1]CAF1649763.1 unnamed protein product [Rotaria sp. Silwood1]CAF3874541.1 unnamed protein product [Rotaria sp. Silwood1]